MSFLEPFADKPAIIIDIGSAYTKCGFAGDSAPTAIIKTDLSQDSLKESLIEFLYKIYYKILNANSRERKLVILESILAKTEFKKILAEVLFNNFQAISVSFLPTHLAAVYTLGINKALVIDFGYTDCQIVPIAECVPLLGQTNFVNLGSKTVHENLKRLLIEYSTVLVNNQRVNFKDVQPMPDLDEEVLEDIKLRCCFVAPFDRALKFYQDEANYNYVPSLRYNLKNNLILEIPGRVREFAFEIFFFNEIDPCQTIPSLILDTLKQCPIDLKKNLASNVLLIGGGSMLNGFKHRLVNEVNNLLNNKLYSDEFSFKKLSYHVPPCHDNCAAWLGGSIFGNLEILDLYSIQNAKYKQIDQLPDWFKINPKSDMMIQI